MNGPSQKAGKGGRGGKGATETGIEKSPTRENGQDIIVTITTTITITAVTRPDREKESAIAIATQGMMMRMATDINGHGTTMIIATTESIRINAGTGAKA